MKRLQFVLPALKQRQLDLIVGAGRGHGSHPATPKLAVQSKLSVKGEAMTMSRHSVGAISSTRSHGEECLELRVESAECLGMAHGRIRFHPFKGSKDGEQASSIRWELMGLGALITGP